MLIAWIFMSIILTNFYKGQLYSLMTAVASVNPPESLQQILDEKLLMSTFSYYTGKYRYRRLSTLLDFILPRLMQGKGGVDYPLFYERLKKTVKFISMEPEEFIEKYLEGRPVEAKRENITFPATFVILSDENEVRKLKWLLKTFSGKKIIAGPTMNSFVYRTTWLSPRNFFSKFLKFSLYRFKESGILDLWDDKSKMFDQVKFLDKMGNVLSRKNDEERGKIGKRVNTDNYFQFIESERNGHRPLLVSEQLSMHVFSVVLILYATCAGVCLVVFAIELVYSNSMAFRTRFYKIWVFLSSVVKTGKCLCSFKCGFRRIFPSISKKIEG